MPLYKFEAMDATGIEIKDEINAPTEEEAQTTIRQMGCFVTKITRRLDADKEKEDLDKINKSLDMLRYERKPLIRLDETTIEILWWYLGAFGVGTAFGLLLRGVFL